MVIVLCLLARAAYELQIDEYIYQGWGRGYRSTVVDVAGFVVLAIPSFVLPLRVRQPGQLLVWIMYLVVLVPTWAVVPIRQIPRDPDTLWLLCLLTLGLLVVHASRQLFAALSSRRVAVSQQEPSAGVVRISPTAAGLSVGVILWSLVVLLQGLTLKLPSLYSVYDVRLSSRSYHAVSGYALAWLGTVVGPWLIVLGVRDRRLWLWVLGLANQFLVFAYDGVKILFLTAAVCSVLAFVFRRRGSFSAFSMLIAVMSATSVALVFALLGQELMLDLFVRRALVAPGLLSGFYYDYFRSSGPTYFAQSILGSFLGSGSSGTGPGFLIGARYIGNSQDNAGANFFMDAFANLGWFGVPVFSAAFGWILGILDRQGRRAGLVLAAPAAAGYGFAVAESSLVTSLSTHGGLLLLGLLFVSRSRPSKVSYR